MIKGPFIKAYNKCQIDVNLEWVIIRQCLKNEKRIIADSIANQKLHLGQSRRPNFIWSMYSL